jgi:hypothetical protein
VTKEPDIVPVVVEINNLKNKGVFTFDLVNGTMRLRPEVIEWLDENVGHSTSMLWLTYSRGLGNWSLRCTERDLDAYKKIKNGKEINDSHYFSFRHAHHAEAFRERWSDIPFWTVAVDYKSMFKHGNRQEPNPKIVELLKQSKQPPSYYLNEFTAEFFLVFFTREDALMFKLAWVDSPYVDFS